MVIQQTGTDSAALILLVVEHTTDASLAEDRTLYGAAQTQFRNRHIDTFGVPEDVEM